MSESLLTKETTPIWFDVHKPIEFDESTARVRLLQNGPATQNTDSALNTSQEIRFEYTPATDQVILMTSRHTCLRLRCTFWSANSTNGTWQGATRPVTGTNGVSLNPNADVTLESCFFGHLFDRAELVVGSSTSADMILSFPIWYQLINHLQPLEFKIANGDAMGYFPDENTGQAVGNVNPYILLVNISAAAVAPNTNGSFGIFAVITTTAAVAANAAISWIIPGTNITLNLVAPAALATNTTYSGIFQIASPLAVAANGTSSFCFQGGILILANGANAVAVGGAANIMIANTTNTALTTETVGVNKYPASTSVLQYPINVPLANQNYEPGYYKRQKLYNTINVGGDGGRQFEILIPLYYLFGFCSWFNRLTSNLAFQIKLGRTINTNPFIGSIGTDGFLMINEMYLQLCQIVPEDSFKVEFNQAIQRPIPVAFMSPSVQNDTITGTNISIKFQTAVYKPDFVFVIFKDTSVTQTTQTNGTLNSNADIKELQIVLNGELYPAFTQDCRWGGTNGSTSNQSVGVNRFYEQFKEVCMKVSGECSMTFKQFRDLYPIFAFDLTAQTMKVKNTNVTFSVLGTRNSNTPTSLTMYTIVLYEKFFEANYLSNTLTLRSTPLSEQKSTPVGVGSTPVGAGVFMN